MTCPSRRAAHEVLVDRMADRLGLDIELLKMKGAVDDYTMDGAVDRCMGCTGAEDCSAWMADHLNPPAPPDYCRNTKLFETLAGDA